MTLSGTQFQRMSHLHSSINCKIDPNVWVQTAHVTYIHEWHDCLTWAIIKNNNNTAHISLLLFEFPLKSSDLYRISPNIPQTLCHPSKGEIVPLN